MSGLNRKNFNRNDFYTEVYNIVQQIPAGRVSTYGCIARLAGYPSYSRLVGKALSDVLPELQLPCHRVVSSQGSTAPHWPEQQHLLEEEGIKFTSRGKIPVHRYLWPDW